MTGRWFWLADASAFFLVLWVVLGLRTGAWSGHQFWSNAEVFFPVFLLVSFVLWLFSFYDMKSLRKHTTNYKMLAVALSLCVLGSASVIYFFTSALDIVTPKLVLVAVLFIYFSYVYWFRKTYFKMDFTKTNLLVLGESNTISELKRFISSSEGFVVEEWGVLAPRPTISWRNLDRVIVASKLFVRQPEAWPEVVDKFIAKGVCVDTDFNEYERLVRRVSRESIGDGMWLLRGIANRRESAVYNMLKRAMDVTIAVVLLPVLLPLGACIWLFIRLIDKYPPFFVQKRMGYLEKPIYVYKFRTIRPGGTEANITRCGKILRRFRLDEIPQVINVLRGDISFVGPRPIWANEHEFLAKHVPNHNIRTIVKPGITGWAQLNFKAPPTYFNFRNDAPENLDPHAFDAAFTRFSYDVWYIKNRSVLLDFEILVKTGLRMFIKDSHVA